MSVLTTPFLYSSDSSYTSVQKVELVDLKDYITKTRDSKTHTHFLSHFLFLSSSIRSHLSLSLSPSNTSGETEETKQREREMSKMMAIGAYFFLSFLFLFSVSINAEDPYRFFTWNVTFGDIYPLGVKQQVRM